LTATVKRVEYELNEDVLMVVIPISCLGTTAIDHPSVNSMTLLYLECISVETGREFLAVRRQTLR
jgi:hypothetical protein